MNPHKLYVGMVEMKAPKSKRASLLDSSIGKLYVQLRNPVFKNEMVNIKDS